MDSFWDNCNRQYVLFLFSSKQVNIRRKLFSHQDDYMWVLWWQSLSGKYGQNITDMFIDRVLAGFTNRYPDNDTLIDSSWVFCKWIIALRLIKHARWRLRWIGWHGVMQSNVRRSHCRYICDNNLIGMKLCQAICHQYMWQEDLGGW